MDTAAEAAAAITGTATPVAVEDQGPPGAATEEAGATGEVTEVMAADEEEAEVTLGGMTTKMLGAAVPIGVAEAMAEVASEVVGSGDQTPVPRSTSDGKSTSRRDREFPAYT